MIGIKTTGREICRGAQQVGGLWRVRGPMSDERPAAENTFAAAAAARHISFESNTFGNPQLCSARRDKQKRSSAPSKAKKSS